MINNNLKRPLFVRFNLSISFKCTIKSFANTKHEFVTIVIDSLLKQKKNALSKRTHT